ncbi:MAG TPA: hypothetical protein VEY70_24915 [Metabacillus sp.]|nr:hypothetical protein [Metabacillus sp.]
MIDLVLAATLSEVLATNYLKKTALNVATSAGSVVVVGLVGVGAFSVTSVALNFLKKDSSK